MDLLHSLTIGDILREHARSYPARMAVVDGDVRLTWPELDARVNQLANALLAGGFEAGDRILWLGQNSFRIIEGLCATAKVGGVFCPANWRQSAKEFEFVIGDVDPRIVIWQDAEIGDAVREARAAVATSAMPDTIWLQHDADPGDADSYESFLAAHPAADPALDIDPASAALMLYTAAFTGTPNGALLSHTAILVQDLVMGMMQEISNDYVYLNCGPLFHIATFMTTMATFHFGGTNVFTPRVEAEELCRLIDAEQCTGAFIMGPTMGEISKLNADGRYNLKSLRTFGGRAEWNEMITVDTSPWARKPAGFGQTEVMGMLTLNAWGGDSAGNSGRPTPMVQVRIVDPDGNEVPLGETGEITARGPTVMNGYHNRDELNAARLAGGWHHTNDLGRRELDGSISFVGPKGRLIKSAAENIYPAEVEACLQTHPAVREAAVIGVPDKKWDQSVKAIVVLKDDQVLDETVTVEDLIEHCRANIASYKKPRTIEFTDALPRLGWPIDYDTLDEQYGGGGYPGESR
jgi:acyl-CoA synthetase (AMP-forming)/AMP-acid ligase II